MAKRQDYSQIGDEDLSLGAVLGVRTPKRKTEKKASPEKASESQRDPLQQPLRLRLERKGHGGKDVTVLQGLGESREAATLVQSLKGALGCGGQFVHGVAMFQGDQRTRLMEELRRRGAQNVR